MLPVQVRCMMTAVKTVITIGMFPLPTPSAVSDVSGVVSHSSKAQSPFCTWRAFVAVVSSQTYCNCPLVVPSEGSSA